MHNMTCGQHAQDALQGWGHWHADNCNALQPDVQTGCSAFPRAAFFQQFSKAQQQGAGARLTSLPSPGCCQTCAGSSMGAAQHPVHRVQRTAKLAQVTTIMRLRHCYNTQHSTATVRAL